MLIGIDETLRDDTRTARISGDLMTDQLIDTSHGKIMVEDHGGSGFPMLLIHGNSSSRHVFARQLKSPLNDLCRLIAFDLPGHGESDDARDPHRTYTLPGFASLVVELLDTLAIKRVIVLGWSLGGHIAIELLARVDCIEGLVLTGSPPIRRGAFAEGFILSPHFALASRRHFSPAELQQFEQVIFGDPALRHAIARADGRFRESSSWPDAKGKALTSAQLWRRASSPSR